MKNSILTPCADWVERLAVRNSDDLSYAQRVALHEHLASCSACATAHSTYQGIGNCICNLPAVEALAGLPYELLQGVERATSRKERAACMFSGILTWLKSLPVLFTRFLNRVNYVSSDNRHFYALREDSGFQLWRYRKSSVFFSSAAVKDGVAYLTLFDAQVFLFASALRLRLSSYSLLWKE